MAGTERAQQPADSATSHCMLSGALFSTRQSTNFVAFFLRIETLDYNVSRRVWLDDWYLNQLAAGPARERERAVELVALQLMPARFIPRRSKPIAQSRSAGPPGFTDSRAEWYKVMSHDESCVRATISVIDQNGLATTLCVDPPLLEPRELSPRPGHLKQGSLRLISYIASSRESSSRCIAGSPGSARLDRRVREAADVADRPQPVWRGHAQHDGALSVPQVWLPLAAAAARTAD